MTKRKNVILERIDVLVDKIEMIDIQLNEINENRKTQYLKTINNIFKSVPNTEIVCGYGATFVFKMMKDDRLDEYFTLYVRENYQSEKLDKIETSFYSTTTDSEFELDRMINLGIIAKLIRKNRENIFYILNSNRKYYRNLTSEIYKEKTSFVNELKELRTELAELKTNEKLELAQTSGIVFETMKRLQIRVDEDIWNATGFKILSITPTGKSATLEVTYKAFDNSIKTTTVKNVRMNYLNRYLK